MVFYKAPDVDADALQVPKPYQKYNNPISEIIEDNERNILILPEVFLTEPLNTAKMIRRAVWWLSVDNYIYGIYIAAHVFKRDDFFNIFSDALIGKGLNFTHLTNSHYAREFLELLGIPRQKVFKLESYIDSVFTETPAQKNEAKTNTVIYNPKKDKAFIKKIMDFCRENGINNINFLPLEGLTPAEVSETFAKAKVYADFGNHPGRERMPREAVVNDCCVITNLRGSAKYYGDIPIPEKYKFEDTPENIPAIVSGILNCFDNYDSCVKDFAEYKKFVQNLESNFENQIKDIFQIAP
jgi:hypothetical protein